MNKKLIPIIATSLILASCFGNTKGGDTPEGKDAEQTALIKTMNETIFDISYNEDDEEVLEQVYHFYKTYNEQGLVVRSEDRTNGGDDTYEYDEKGQLVKMVTASNDYEFGSLYEYDEEGNLLKETDSETGNMIVRYEYDDNNLCTTSYDYDRDDETVMTENYYEYNDKGEKTTCIQKNMMGNDTATMIVSYKYDSHGNVTEESTEYDGSVVSVESHEYEYDEYGNWTADRVTTQYFDGEGELETESSIKIVREIEYW